MFGFIKKMLLILLKLERKIFLKNFENIYIYIFDILISFEKIFPGNI